MCFIEVPYDIFIFVAFAINRKMGRTTTFSDEELFTKKTFQELGLKGKSKLMPGSFFLTIGHLNISRGVIWLYLAVFFIQFVKP